MRKKSNDTWPVVVFTQISQPFVTDYTGNIIGRVLPEMKTEAVGMLFPAGENDFIRVQSEAAAHGCTADIIIRQFEPSPGYAACGVAFRVTAPNMEIARNLPGFIGIYEYSGDFYNLLNLNRDNDHLIRKTDFMIEYRLPDGAHPPRMETDDAACVSFSPMGEEGSAVFLAEKPGSWFHMFGVEDEAITIIMIRKLIA